MAKDIILKIKAITDSSVPKSIDMIKGSLENANSKGFIPLLRKANQLRFAFQKIGKDTRELNSAIKSVAESTRQFNFAFLSFLFTGMMMKQMFGGLFNSIIDGYRKAQEENSYFNTVMSQVGARVEYLKVLFMDAFVNSGVFQFLIDAFFSITDFIANIPDSVKQWTVAGLGFLAFLGTVLVLIGGVLQAVELLKAVQISLAGSEALTALSNGWGKVVSMFSVLIRMVRFFGWLLSLWLLGKIIMLFIKKINDFKGNWKDTLWYVWGVMSKWAGKILLLGVKLFKGLVEVFKAIRDALFNIVMYPINSALNNLASSLRRFGFNKLARKVEAFKLTPDKVYSSSDAFVEKLFNSLENKIQKRIDDIQGALDDADKFYGVTPEKTTGTTQNTSTTNNVEVKIDNITIGNDVDITNPDEISSYIKDSFNDIFKDLNTNIKFNTND